MAPGSSELEDAIANSATFEGVGEVVGVHVDVRLLVSSCDGEIEELGDGLAMLLGD